MVEIQLTGLERIATLESEMKAIQHDLNELIVSVKTVEGLLIEGRGAVRLAKTIAGLLAIFGVGWLGHAKVTDFLKWLGQ